MDVLRILVSLMTCTFIATAVCHLSQGYECTTYISLSFNLSVNCEWWGVTHNMCNAVCTMYCSLISIIVLLLLCPHRGVKYCSERVCLSVWCLSVCSLKSKIVYQNFRFSMHCGMWLWLNLPLTTMQMTSYLHTMAGHRRRGDCTGGQVWCLWLLCFVWLSLHYSVLCFYCYIF